jgi:hypothetical protein
LDRVRRPQEIYLPSGKYEQLIASEINIKDSNLISAISEYLELLKKKRKKKGREC